MFVQTINRDHDSYPVQLKQLSDPPEQIYCSGEGRILRGPFLSIVGAREVKYWVKEWLEAELLPVLKELNIGVVSGGARGVDQYAHWLAVRADVPTVVVLPSGLDNVYPKSLSSFIKKKSVSLVTEYAPDTEMRKHHFYNRNRIIAALTPLTFVVQSSEKSGTMITAKKAIDLGKCVATLPGHPVDPSFSGNNQLLYDGAMMVRNQNDLKQLILSEIPMGD